MKYDGHGFQYYPQNNVVTIVSSTLQLKDGIISGSITLNVSNNTGNIQSANAVLVIYDKYNKMIFSTLNGAITLNPGINTQTFSGISVSNATADTYTVKLIYLDSLGTMTPLAEAKTLDLNAQ